jgi:hypothetical protein
MSARTSQARSSGRLSSVFVSDQPCPILDYIAQAAARHNTSDWRPLFDSRAGHGALQNCIILWSLYFVSS